MVTVSEERTATFWVRAPDRSTAQEDADVLASSLVRDGEWDQSERNVDVFQERRIRRSPAAGEMIWSGGPDGDWETP